MGRTAEHVFSTQRDIDKIPIPDKPSGGGSISIGYSDTGCEYLRLFVSSSGAKRFVYQRRLNGVLHKKALGTLSPRFRLENARKKARALTVKLDAAPPPVQHEGAISGETTLGQLFEGYLENYAKPRKLTWRGDEFNFKKHLSHWSGRRIDTIHRADVERLLNGIKANSGDYMRNRMQALLSKLFNKAIDWGYAGLNPVYRIEKAKEHQRDRYLTDAELPYFFDAVESMSEEVIRDAILMLLFTGARRGNVLAMQWNQVQGSEWTIPRTKNDNPHTVPLTPAALAILERRRAVNPEAVFVFESPRKPGQHLKEIKTAWKHVLETAEIENLRPHDLRRTLGSWMAITGTSLHIIGAALGHKEHSVTGIYARLSDTAIRAAMEKAVTAILQAAGRGESSDVIQLGAVK